MAVNAQLRLWVPWHEFAGTTRGTIDEFRGILRKYRRSSLLIACARLGAAFNFGPDGRSTPEEERVKAWLPNVFPPHLAQRALQYIERNRIVFFQAQLRYLAAEALRLDPAPSEGLPPIENWELGELLLRAGELLYAPHPDVTEELDHMADLLARFLPVYEIDSPTDPFLPLMRFYIFLTINIPRLPDKERSFDVKDLFEKQFCFPLKAYCLLVYAFLIHAMTERENRPPDVLIDAGIRVSWFNQTTLPADLVQRIFDSVSFTLQNLPKAKPPIGYADFEFLRDNPYFSYDDVLYCLDFDFALGKLESGALWRVMKSLPSNERVEYLGFWGKVFEDYVAWLFELYAPKKHNRCYASPRYEDDQANEICDAIVICGSTAILIEEKLATCPADVKYSDDYRKVRKYLEEKLVVGTDRPVGVAQLLKVIEKLTSAEPSILPPWLRRIKKFIPLIITRDEIGSCWAINSYLDARFDGQLDRKAHRGYTITPLVIMSVATLERAMRNLQKIAFSTIIEDRIKSDRKLGRPFEAASKYVSRGTARMMSAHLDVLRTLTNELISDFGMKDTP